MLWSFCLSLLYSWALVLCLSVASSCRPRALAACWPTPTSPCTRLACLMGCQLVSWPASTPCRTPTWMVRGQFWAVMVLVIHAVWDSFSDLIPPWPDFSSSIINWKSLTATVFRNAVILPIGLSLFSGEVLQNSRPWLFYIYPHPWWLTMQRHHKWLKHAALCKRHNEESNAWLKANPKGFSY